MHFLIITAVLLTTSFSQAAVEGFNGMIQEASVSEKILRRKLLKILQNTEVSIAASNKNEQLQNKYPSPDFEVKLVKASP